MPSNPITISTKGVILPGETYCDINFPIPSCSGDMEFLIQGFHVGPEVCVGATSLEVIYLPIWAVSVPVFQRSLHGSIQVALTAISHGPNHISVTIPSGQSTEGFSTVRINLLGGVRATHRFEFNVHITGVCGVPYIAP